YATGVVFQAEEDIRDRNVTGVQTCALPISGSEASVHMIEKSDKVTDVTGAGDSFSAAVVYGWLKGMDIEDTIKLGMINSRKTIETSYTVRQDLDEHQLLKNLEEIK